VPAPSVTVTQMGPDGFLRGFGADGDAAGNYVVVGPNVGDFTVTAQHFGSGLTGTATGHLDNVSTAATANVSLKPSGNVVGVLRDANNNPVPNISIQVVSSGLNYQRSTTTDAQGAYRVDDIAVGRVTVQAFAYPWIAVGRGDLTATGQTITVDLALPPTGTLTGTVRNASGAPVAGARVYVEDATGASTNAAIADSAGAYTVQAPAGSVRATGLVVTDLTHAGVTETTLPANGSATADIALGNAAYAYSQMPLTGSDGFVYRPYCNGSLISGGTTDGRLASSYSYYSYRVSIGGSGLPCRISWPLEQQRQQIVVGPVAADVLTVTRKLFVPAAGGFARFVDSLTNPTTNALTVDVEVNADLTTGSAARVVVAPSSSSFYAVTDRTDGAATPVLAHVFGGSGARATPSATHFVTGDAHLSYRWTVMIAAGETVSLMHFAVQRDRADQSGAVAAAQALSGLTDPNALVGLSAAERARIINFNVPQP